MQNATCVPSLRTRETRLEALLRWVESDPMTGLLLDVAL